MTTDPILPILLLAIAVAASLVQSLNAAESYAVAKLPPPGQAWDVGESKTFAAVMQLVASIEPADSNRQSLLIAKMHDLEAKIPSASIKLTFAQGRMPLPENLLSARDGFLGGLDSEAFISYLSHDVEQFGAMMGYVLCWKALEPSAAFAVMSERSNEPTPTLIDLLTLQAFLSAPPGQKLRENLTKASWQELHQSHNPCYRFIALEKFDSVDQTPSELVALYRECLFNACSYLEVRALEAITNNQDFRPEVLALLEEYAASNPPKDDGSLPELRNQFPDPVQGAKSLMGRIPLQEQPIKEDTRTQSREAAKLPPQTQAIPPAPADALPSITWFVWLLVVITAIIGVWILVRKASK